MRWGQQGIPSSPWMIGVGRLNFGLILLLFTLLHFVMAAVLPPVEDEVYFWTWGQNLALSYYDHPPMIALWNKVASSLFGNSLFALRLPAVLATTFVFCLLYWTTNDSKILKVLLLSPIVFFGGILMTPDVPLLVFWTLYFMWMVRINGVFNSWGGDPVSRVYRREPVHILSWMEGGLWLGLGLLCKYSMVLAVFGSLSVLFLRYRVKAWAKGFAVHLLVAFLVASPILIFNLQHDFIPFKFQWFRQVAPPSFSLLRLTQFWGVQILLFGLLPLIIVPWIVLRWNEIKEHPQHLVSACFFLAPLSLVFFMSVRNFLEANWTIPVYLSLWPLAHYLLSTSSFRYATNAIMA